MYAAWNLRFAVKRGQTTESDATFAMNTGIPNVEQFDAFVWLTDLGLGEVIAAKVLFDAIPAATPKLIVVSVGPDSRRKFDLAHNMALTLQLENVRIVEGQTSWNKEPFLYQLYDIYGEEEYEGSTRLESLMHNLFLTAKQPLIVASKLPTELLSNPVWREFFGKTTLVLCTDINTVATLEDSTALERLTAPEFLSLFRGVLLLSLDAPSSAPNELFMLISVAVTDDDERQFWQGVQRYSEILTANQITRHYETINNQLRFLRENSMYNPFDDIVGGLAYRMPDIEERLAAVKALASKRYTEAALAPIALATILSPLAPITHVGIDAPPWRTVPYRTDNTYKIADLQTGQMASRILKVLFGSV